MYFSGMKFGSSESFLNSREKFIPPSAPHPFTDFFFLILHREKKDRTERVTQLHELQRLVSVS